MAKELSRLDVEFTRLNERYAHLLHPGLIIEFPPPEGSTAPYLVVPRQAFLDHFSEQFLLPGSDDKYRSLAHIWLHSPTKRAYERVGMWEPASEPARCLNLYRGIPERTSLRVSPRQAQLSRVSGWPRFNEFLWSVVAHENRALFDHLLDWVAFLIQRPLQKSEVAVVLVGDQGVGKTFLMSLIADLYHPSQTISIAQESQAVGNFNAHLEGKLFVRLEEALFGRDPRHRGAYKDLITSRRRLIEHKGANAYFADDFINVMAATNYLTSVSIEPGDRRHTVTRLSSVHRNDKTYFRDIEDEWVSGGREAFIGDMRARAISSANSMVGLNTPEKAELTEASGGMAVLYWAHVLDRSSLPGLRAMWSHDGSPQHAWETQGAFVPLCDLASDYADFAHQSGARAAISAAELGRNVMNLCSAATQHRRTVAKRGQLHGLDIPDLPTCRALYNQAVGGA